MLEIGSQLLTNWATQTIAILGVLVITLVYILSRIIVQLEKKKTVIAGLKKREMQFQKFVENLQVAVDNAADTPFVDLYNKGNGNGYLTSTDRTSHFSHLDHIDVDTVATDIDVQKTKTISVKKSLNGNGNHHNNGKIYFTKSEQNDLDALLKEFKSLQDLKTHLYNLLYNSPVPIGLYKAGRWNYMNQAALDLLGIDNECDIYNEGIFKFIKSECRADLLAKLKKGFLDGQKSMTVRQKIHRFDGAVLDVELIIIPTENDGVLQSGQIIIRDVTESYRIQKELKKARKLEMAGRMAGQASQNYKKLLTSLSSNVTHLKRNIPEKHPIHNIVNKIESYSNRMADINQQLLYLGQRGQYNMKPCDMNHLVANNTSLQPLPKGVYIDYSLADDLYMVPVSEEHIRRVYSNLLQNACDAMKEDGGILTVKTRNITLARPLKGYSSINVGDYMRLDVCDSGAGMEAEVQDKIFDPFFSTKKQGLDVGTGLGLCVVREIIHEHKGYITVNSATGKGTTVSVYLPVAGQEENVEKSQAESEYRNNVHFITDLPLDNFDSKLNTIKYRTACSM